MRFRVEIDPEAKEQRAKLPPGPKRRVKELLRELEEHPYGPISRRLTLVSDDVVYRVREDGYRILFRPGSNRREIRVLRIALRAVAYKGFEHPGYRD